MPVEVEMVLRLLLAATLGAVIGFQREKAGRLAHPCSHLLRRCPLYSGFHFSKGESIF